MKKPISGSALPISPPLRLLSSGDTVPILGMGTWHMGDNSSRRNEEITALRTGIDNGLTLIDTAEMYGDGRAELLLGEAIHGIRERVYLVSKVLPTNASRHGVTRSCEASLRRLGTDYLDLYLLHWRGNIPLEDTLAGFQDLIKRGLIRSWGVSNFDVEDIDSLPAGETPVVNQILYNLSRRWPESRLFPAHSQRGITTMAYSPLEQKRILKNRILAEIAEKFNTSPACIALAWILRRKDTLVIPKASSVLHVKDNIDSLRIAENLNKADVTALNHAFPSPSGSYTSMEVL